MSRSGPPSRSRPQEPRSRRAPGALIAALALLAILAAPTSAAQGPTKLENPTITPASGSPTTTITIEITFRDVRDREPEFVRVIIGETIHEMDEVGDVDWRAGVRFRWSGTLPLGEHAVRFEAADWEKFVDSLDAGTITITLPPPPEMPRTRPAPPEDEPGDHPEAESPEAPEAAADYPYRVAAGEYPRWDEAESSALALVRRSGEPGGGSGEGTAGTGGAGAAGSGGPAGEADAGAAGDPHTGSAEVLDGLAFDPPALLAALLPGPDRGILPTLPALVVSAGGAGLWLAFSLFGKRRRDERPDAPDDVMRFAAASGAGVYAGAALLPGSDDPEAFLPRWRRPSLLEARRVDPIREGFPERQSLVFGTDRDSSHERRRIRYATVRLLDRPDETLGFAVGDLGDGDEVELLERSGLYRFVRAPDGRSGWVHRMTLGDLLPTSEPPVAGENRSLADLLAARGPG